MSGNVGNRRKGKRDYNNHYPVLHPTKGYRYVRLGLDKNASIFKFWNFRTKEESDPNANT